jgi:NAD(P)-dependent dehydrogenase (short-subunit alcohol dehydrogenase family)
MSDRNLNGKAAIVVGGGGGMGRAIVLALVKNGARVTILDNRESAIAPVLQEATSVGDSENAIAVVCDVTKIDDCQRAVRETLNAFNSADILVNVAGIGMQTMSDDYWKEPVRFWQADVERFSRMMHVNWHGAFMMAREVTPHMIDRGWGRIINVTTSLDTMYRAGNTPYGPSKAALEAATSIWAQDLEGTGVTANVLVPGGPVNAAFLSENTPFDRTRIIQPDVMGPPACWLASDASDDTTNRRFVARDWDEFRSDEVNLAAACDPCAWPNVGKKAFRPD